MKRGFTLIELLAVIVILAIIALITIPAVLRMTDNAKVGSYRRSIDLYGKALNQAIATYERDMTEKGEKINLSLANIEKYIDYEGNDVDCDTTLYSDKTIFMTDCKVDNNSVYAEEGKGYGTQNYYFYTNSKKKIKTLIYIEAVNEILKGRNISGTYKIEKDGSILVNGEKIQVSSKLENAEDGMVTLENGKVTSYSNLKFKNQKQETNSEVAEVVDNQNTGSNNQWNQDNNINTYTDNSYMNTYTDNSYINTYIEPSNNGDNTNNSNGNTNNNTGNGSCLWVETEIIVYDAKRKRKYKKKLRDLTEDDLIMVWDFDKGEFSFIRPLWIRKTEIADSYYLLKFSDGSELRIIHDHRIFNADTNMFESGIEVPIGTKTFNSDGEIVKLISREKIDEEIEFSSVITDYHMNLFAGDILTSIKLNNLYPIKDMKFVKNEIVNNNKDMFYNVSDDMYNGLRLSEANFKDYYTISEINEFIEGIKSVNKLNK